MRRRKKKQFIFCEVIKNLNRFAGIIWEKKEKKKPQCSKRHRVYVNFLYLSKISREISEPLKNT